MNNRKYEIKKCRSCGSKLLEDVLSLGDLYLSYFTKSDKKPPQFPLDLVYCSDCGLVQLRHTTPQQSLYTENYGYRSGINDTMRNELKIIVEKAKEHFGKKPENFTVVDIGANDGTLLGNYGKNVLKIAVEPIKKLAREAKTKSDIVINDFFNYEAFNAKMKDRKAHIITVISCFYDMEEPNTFVKDLKKIMHTDGIIIIQQNYLVGMLKLNAFDNIVHEHLEYYSLYSMENLFKKYGLQIYDVELSPINGGSFRTYICKVGERDIKKSVIKMRQMEKKIGLEKKAVYRKFADRVIKNRKKIHSMIRGLVADNKSVYVYGASTRGNTLLQYYNLDNALITAAVERNPEKWGTKIASVGIPIISESKARKEKPDYMLVLPWFFRDEFLQREKSYLDSGGHFIFPLPQVEVI